MPGEQRFYSEDEAQEILRLAAGRTNSGLSRDELLRAALELGIPSESIEQAEAEISMRRESEQRALEERQLRAEFERQYRAKLTGEMSSFASATVLFLVIWWMTGRGYFWPMWVLPWMGLGAVTSFFSTYLDRGKKERKYQEWLSKRGRMEVTVPAGTAEISIDENGQPTIDHSDNSIHIGISRRSHRSFD